MSRTSLRLSVSTIGSNTPRLIVSFADPNHDHIFQYPLLDRILRDLMALEHHFYLTRLSVSTIGSNTPRLLREMSPTGDIPNFQYPLLDRILRDIGGTRARGPGRGSFSIHYWIEYSATRLRAPAAQVLAALSVSTIGSNTPRHSTPNLRVQNFGPFSIHYWIEYSATPEHGHHRE